MPLARLWVTCSMSRDREPVVLPGSLNYDAGVDVIYIATCKVGHYAALPCPQSCLRYASQSGAGCKRLQATHISAIAKLTVLIDGHMTNLAAEAAGSGEELVVDDDSPTDAGTDGHIDHVGTSSACAIRMLTHSAQSCVVAGEYGEGEPFLQERYRCVEVPFAAEIRGIVHHAGSWFDGTCKGETDPTRSILRAGRHVFQGFGEPVHNGIPALAGACFRGVPRRYHSSVVDEGDASLRASNVGYESIFGH